MARDKAKDESGSAWRAVRIGFLLLVLAAVAVQTWLERVTTQSWHQTLWVGIYPLNGDGTSRAQSYLDGLTVKDFASVETFFAREAHRYGLRLDEPVHVELYPQGSTLPPMLASDASALGVAWWSLKLRWFAHRSGQVPGQVPVRIRLFVLYHDPSTLQSVPDSHGLQKGLVGVLHIYADPTMAGSNNVVIAHELLHTVGATDKYDLSTGLPLFPEGFADPERDPRYPQEQTEIMAGRRPVSALEADIPQSLREVIVGPASAREIKWTRN